jgi:hypothetical protein
VAHARRSAARAPRAHAPRERAAQADDRRLAEVHYKAALALQFRGAPSDALAHAHAAVRVLRARIARLRRVAAGAPPGAGPDPGSRPDPAAAAAAGPSGAAAGGPAPSEGAPTGASLGGPAAPAAGGAASAAGAGSHVPAGGGAAAPADATGASADSQAVAQVRGNTTWMRAPPWGAPSCACLEPGVLRPSRI